MKTTLIVAGAVVALIAGTAFKLADNKEAVEKNVYRRDPDGKVLVQTDTVAVQSFDRVYGYTGTFVPVREVMIVPQVHGEVTGVFFEEGDKVRSGAKLVQVDDELLQAQFASAEASYQIAKRNLERHEKAAGSGGVSPIQLDGYRLTYKNAEAQWKQLAKQIRLSQMIAPFAGTVTFKDVEAGAVVSTSPVARVTDLSQLKLEFVVPEKEIALFHVGDQMPIETAAMPGKHFSGRIHYVAKRADDAHNYTVKVLVDNDASVSLKAGMYGNASLKGSLGTESLAVPRSALLGSVKDPQVFVVQNEVAVLRHITTGVSSSDRVAVIAGIEPGEIVVTGGQINLAPGIKVEIAQ